MSFGVNSSKGTQVEASSEMARRHPPVTAPLVLLISMVGVAAAQAPVSKPPDNPTSQLHWYRGNTHTHTINSDGDAAPDVVTRWYREHDYQFLVITDHEYLTDIAPLNVLFGAAGQFLVMKGQEVTQRLIDPAHPDGRRQAHINSINPHDLVLPIGPKDGIASGISMLESYRRNIGEWCRVSGDRGY